MRADHEGFPEREIKTPPFASIVRKARHEQRALQLGCARYVDRLAVQPRAAAPPRDEHLAPERVEDDSRLKSAAPLVGDRDAELREAVDKIGRAIERVDDPAVLAEARR